VLVLDSAPLLWHDTRVQNLREALTDAYPSGSKAEDIVSRVRWFPQHGVNWNHQDGASTIWKIVLTLAAQTGSLRSLLSQVLKDQTVAAHHTRIRDIIAELDADADSADETQPNASTPRPPPQLVKVDEYDGDSIESLDQITGWERAVSSRCRKALEGIVPAVMARPDLAAESIDEALAALRTVDVILNTLSVAAVAHAADPLRYARLSQAAENLRADRDAASGTLRRLRRAQRPKATSSLCDTLACQATSLYAELESACSLLR